MEIEAYNSLRGITLPRLRTFPYTIFISKFVQQGILYEAYKIKPKIDNYETNTILQGK